MKEYLKKMCIRDRLTPEAGAHCGVMYSQEELYSAYDRFSATLAEALGSSGEPEQILSLIHIFPPAEKERSLTLSLTFGTLCPYGGILDDTPGKRYNIGVM